MVRKKTAHKIVLWPVNVVCILLVALQGCLHKTCMGPKDTNASKDMFAGILALIASGGMNKMVADLIELWLMLLINIMS